MQNNRELGMLGEDIASNYISEQGYVVLQRNFRTKVGEIDIVARDGNSLVFVEVKTRRSLNFGYPREAVNQNKQAKIREVAFLYLNTNGKHHSHIRFDVIEVMLNFKNDLVSINILKNAF